MSQGCGWGVTGYLTLATCRLITNKIIVITTEDKYVIE